VVEEEDGEFRFAPKKVFCRVCRYPLMRKITTRVCGTKARVSLSLCPNQRVGESLSFPVFGRMWTLEGEREKEGNTKQATFISLRGTNVTHSKRSYCCVLSNVGCSPCSVVGSAGTEADLPRIFS
jgi:hypothetical protein